MLDKKDIEESREIAKEMMRSGIIMSSSQKEKEFFMSKAESSFETARLLFEISGNVSLKKQLGAADDFDAYMWVINSAYYSMFYAATALLAHHNHRIKTEIGIHKFTYHALVYYFLDCDKKLPRHFLEQYKEIAENAEEILQVSEEKARAIVESVRLEIEKRKTFTYEMGMSAKQSKALTSLNRAKEFITVAKELMVSGR